MHTENVVFTGNMFQVVQWEGMPGKTFERVERAPGTRLVIETEQGGVSGLWMTREIRRETGNIDLRLPGGKVFDSLTKYNAFQQSGKDMVPEAEVSARREAVEEAGVTGGEYTLLAHSRAGASVEWDLYYFLVQGGVIGNQELTEEEIGKITACFVSYKDLQTALKTGAIQEDRSAAVLYRYLDNLNLTGKL